MKGRIAGLPFGAALFFFDGKDQVKPAKEEGDPSGRLIFQIQAN